jgi:exopolysaccharide production protein ExoQ
MRTELQSSVPKQALQRGSLKPPRLEWHIAIFMVLIQQAAFILIPNIMQEEQETEAPVFEYRTVQALTNTDETAKVIKRNNREPKGAEQSPLNTAGLSISLCLLPIVCLPRMRCVVAVIADNPFVCIYLAVTLLSATWSIYPDISIRRGIVCFISMSIAVYLVASFRGDDHIKLISNSIVISFVGSIAFVGLFPRYGIMSAYDLEGDWRGVFIHKNSLGSIMAVGLFTQLYLLAARTGRIGWRIFWAILFFGVVLLSRSTTALVTCLLYLSMFFLYVVWLQHKALGYGVGLMLVFFLIAIGIVLAVDPESVLGLLGKDATLTGRTDVWAAVLDLIGQRPLLGWGYRAMFVDGDPTTDWIWERVGWQTPGAHNSLLEITLELGVIGLFSFLMILGTALARGLRCCLTGVLPLGYFSLVFFIGILIEGTTESELGGGQDLKWLLFNMLAFACGQSLSLQKSKRPARSPP